MDRGTVVCRIYNNGQAVAVCGMGLHFPDCIINCIEGEKLLYHWRLSAVVWFGRVSPGALCLGTEKIFEICFCRHHPYNWTSVCTSGAANGIPQKTRKLLPRCGFLQNRLA